jgi:coenzyme F420-reducing hydrogenase alpha subunit
MSEPPASARRTIRTDYLARVEGEGAMYVALEGSEVREVRLRIYEPPRFFEAMLRGRAFTEAPDITARICGICPIAYQMSSARAMEDACGVTIDDGPIRDLRRLIYCGEWIESHSLHVYLLHAPDFLGYPGFVEMARDHPQIAEQGLQMKKAGNQVMTVIGGREVHPINLRVGGFYRAPSRRELQTLVEPLQRARETALQRTSRPDPRARLLSDRPAGPLQPLVCQAAAAGAAGRAGGGTAADLPQPVSEHHRAWRRARAGLR